MALQDASLQDTHSVGSRTALKRLQVRGERRGGINNNYNNIIQQPFILPFAYLLP